MEEVFETNCTMTDAVAALIIAATTTGVTVSPTVIDAAAQVPLGTALPAFVFVAGLVWWLARRLQHIEDQVAQVRKDLESRPCQAAGKCRAKDDDYPED